MNRHPLINQLHFTRSEFMRGIKHLSQEDAGKRLMPMNCISWNVGHLAWQEQRYFLFYTQGLMPFPDIDKNFAYGAPGSTPPLKDMLNAWKAITSAADPWLSALTSTDLSKTIVRGGKPSSILVGNLLQRAIYHYWYHTGENSSIRQLLGHGKLPQFVGNIDGKAPYKSESS